MPDSISEWLTWLHGDARELTLNVYFKEFCEKLVEAGIPIRRANLSLRELHPEYLVRSFDWRRTGVETRRFFRADAADESEAYERSPVKVMFESHQTIRCRIDPDRDSQDYPILDDLAEEGLTDYVIFPVMFRRGETQALSIATDRQAGFFVEDLTFFKAILPAFATQLEVLVLDQMVHTLLDTYVGPSAGKRVLSGAIARGTGVPINAVLLFADLRQFTELSEMLDNDALITLLNDYFQCLVEPIEDGGGEVLKFIGDAILAVFPLPARAIAGDVVCEVALAAAEQAIENVIALSRSRTAAGHPPLDFGVALHVGNVVFGNVGSEHRLDFTVIGRDVNLASRLQGLSATLGHPLILSQAFVTHSKRNFIDLGEHALKGIAIPERAYTLKAALDTVVGATARA